MFDVNCVNRSQLVHCIIDLMLICFGLCFLFFLMLTFPTYVEVESESLFLSADLFALHPSLSRYKRRAMAQSMKGDSTIALLVF